jgi:hypothetical protein
VDRRAPRVRGLSLRHWLSSLERLHGADTRRALVAELPDDASGAIGDGLRDDGWYPLAWWSAMLAGARAEIRDDLAVIEELARHSSRSEFSTVHRILLLFVTPQHLLRISRRVFSRYYDHGWVESLPVGRREAQVRWGGCRGFDDNIWHDCFTASAVAVEQCGAREVSWEIVDGGGEQECATVHYRWR